MYQRIKLGHAGDLNLIFQGIQYWIFLVFD